MPAVVSNVREPLGVVDWEEAIDGSMEGAIDGALEVDEACGSEGIVDMLLATEGDEGAGEPLLEVPLRGEAFREELRDWELSPRLAMLDTGDVTGGAAARETIFMPLLVLVLAGMNNVRLWSGPGIDILCGWLRLHPAVVSCVPDMPPRQLSASLDQVSRASGGFPHLSSSHAGLQQGCAVFGPYHPCVERAKGHAHLRRRG